MHRLMIVCEVPLFGDQDVGDAIAIVQEGTEG